MNWRSWLTSVMSPCAFLGHEEPIKVVSGKVLSFQCPRCQADMGRVLKGQKFKARKPAKKLRVVRPARVIHGEGRFQ